MSAERSNTKVYLGVFAALAFLTALTVWSSYLDLGKGRNIALALAIAFFKVSLIAAFFMHLKSEKRAVHALFYGAALLALLLFLLVLPDLGLP